ncbi:unnamed protein product [Blepharisma stoltei]|uniref:Receptor ligand binding region domain-containing protein n=1 Tax=Blepharisma stoltei TaxID=1481888 RepID=A0AAU9K1H9_9CILI|nr:unnamed protein product [Blepharisma stoltei]
MGSTLYYISIRFTDTKDLQEALITAKLLTTGNGILLAQRSGYECEIEGSLIISELGYENISSEVNYMKKSIENAINFILNSTTGNDADEIITMLNLKWNQQTSFSLINIQNKNRTVVGHIINGNLEFFEKLTFIGNSSEIPKSTRKALKWSIEAGGTNPGSLSTTVSVIGGRGSAIAQDEINNKGSQLLSNFQLQSFNFDCGATFYDQAFATACYKNDIDKFGLAHISPLGSAMAYYSMLTFKKLNLTFPNVGCTNADASLNNTKIFPWYARVQISSSYAFSLVPILLNALGWKEIGILYQNDSYGQSGYYYIKQSIEKQDIRIVNSEDSRVIPANLNRTSVKDYKRIIQRIIDSEARLLVYLLQFPLCNYVMEELYDLGMRKGDIIIFTLVTDLLPLYSYNDTFLYKRLEIGTPMFTIVGQNWAGDLGKNVLSKYTETYKSSPNSFTCFYYDGLYLIAHALDYMINRGLDYYDPTKLMAAIRNQQFIGCTGRVSIEKGSNDRIMDTIDIQGNWLYDNGTLIVYKIGDFRPFSLKIISIEHPIFYPDGTTNKPTDLRNANQKCPFKDRLIKTFTSGRLLLFGICFAVALESIIITVVIWKKWWDVPIEPLTQREEISFQDLIVGFTICIEFFQFSAMGPDFSPISVLLSDLSNSFSLDLDDVLKMESGVFWIIVDAVFGGIALWLLLCIVVLTRLDERFPSFSPFRFLDWVADYLMPILGNLCFIPFVSICLDIFVCDQSIGDSFTDSFLSKDCTYFCWKDEHLVYAILSFFALLAYEPFAVFCRPLWQELQLFLHVKTVPLYLMVKSIFQIALIVLNKTVKRATGLGHGVIFIVLMVIYVVFIFRFKPYNYPRFSWWQALSLIGVIWIAFLSTVILGAGGDSNIYLILLFAGWVILILFGFYVQTKKYPSMLYRKKAGDTSTLFKFAFTFGKVARSSLAKIIPSSESKSNRLANE